MTHDNEAAAALWLAAVIHEVVQPTSTALVTVGQAAEQLERAVTALRRASRGAEALRWLVRVLRKDAAAAAALAPCSVAGALAELSPTGPDLRSEVQPYLSVLSAPGVLHLVLGNLLANASRHAGGTLVTVRAASADAAKVQWPHGAEVRLQGRVVLLTVADEGRGVVDPRRLFEPFETAGPGAGIGLWLCRLAVRAHGGDLWCNPTQQGASFTSVWLNSVPLDPENWPRGRYELGIAIRQARQAAGLTRAELAQRSGLAESTVRNIENGWHQCTSNTLCAITEALAKGSASW